MFPHFRHLSVQNGGAVASSEIPLAHGDGGFGDNLGVLPLLARQVHNILVFVNTSTHDFEANDDVKALFFPVGPPDGSGDKTHNEAFEPGDYDRLMKGLQKQKLEGKPLFHCDRNRNVRANAHFNVRGVQRSATSAGSTTRRRPNGSRG